MTNNKILIFITLLIIIAASTIFYGFNNHSRKIQHITKADSFEWYQNNFAKSINNNEFKLIKDIHCNETDRFEQTDIDYFLNKFINTVKQQDWSKIKIEADRESNTVTFSNIFHESKPKTQAITVQKATYNYLFGQKDYACFYIVQEN